MLQRRWILNASAGALLAGAVGAPVGVWAQVQDVNDAINKAGRQRMLSQRMAKFCLAAMLQVDAATSTTEIDKARKEFLSANELLRTAPQATDRIRQELLAQGKTVKIICVGKKGYDLLRRQFAKQIIEFIDLRAVRTLGFDTADPIARKIITMFEAGEFDVIAVGRALLADPNWVNRLRDGDLDEFAGFDAATALARLY